MKIKCLKYFVWESERWSEMFCFLMLFRNSLNFPSSRILLILNVKRWNIRSRKDPTIRDFPHSKWPHVGLIRNYREISHKVINLWNIQMWFVWIIATRELFLDVVHMSTECHTKERMKNYTIFAMWCMWMKMKLSHILIRRECVHCTSSCRIEPVIIFFSHLSSTIVH